MKRREYLDSFLEEFGYPEGAKDTLRDTLSHVDSLALERILALYEGKDSGWDWKEILKETKDLSAESKVSEYAMNLLVLILMAEKLERMYGERGLSHDMFHAMMMDLYYKNEECHAVYGLWGNFVAGWCIECYDLSRVALGRLQFEVIPFKHTYEKDGVKLTPESKVVNVHIPRDGRPLSKELTDEAFRMAEDYYRPQLGKVVFVCFSWLLWSENRNIIPSSSNIHSFMDYFDIIENETYGDERPEIWRLFDTMEKNLQRLPADTSLRRSYIEHMKRGGTTGSGFGVYIP